MNHQLPFKALNQRNFPTNISFQSTYQLQDFAKKFLYRYFFNVQTKKPDRFSNLFFTSLTLSSLSICEDELWYMWCLTTLYATKLVFLVKPVLTHLTNHEFSPDLLCTLLEWYSPLRWWRKQLQNLCTFHGLDRMQNRKLTYRLQFSSCTGPTSSTHKQKTTGHKTWHMNGKLTLVHILSSMIHQ